MAFCLALPCNPSPCQNNGRCVIDEGDFDCICPDGYSGQYCQVGECIITETMHFLHWMNLCIKDSEFKTYFRSVMLISENYIL